MTIEGFARLVVAVFSGLVLAGTLPLALSTLGLIDWSPQDESVWTIGDPPLRMYVVAASATGFALAIWLLLDDLLTHLAIAVASVALGVASAVFLQTLLYRQDGAVEWLGFTVFVAGLAYVTYRATREQSPKRKPLSLRERLGPTISPALFAFVSAFVIAFLFLQYAVGYFPIIAQWLPLLVPGSTNGELNELAGKVDQFLNVLTALASLFAASVVAQEVSPTVRNILSYVGLNPDQIAAAQRLRQPIGNAFRGTPLTSAYDVQVNITPTTSLRDLPHITSTRNKAIVRILLPREPRWDAGEHLSFTNYFWDWHERATSAGVSLANSLVFVYADSERTSPPLCYGTGLEFFELLEPPSDTARGRLQAQFSDEFDRALRTGDGALIRSTVAGARAQILRYNPHDDVLLSVHYVRETDDVTSVMRLMSAQKLRRILVVTDRSPIEMAIASAPELSTFLLAQ